MQTVNIELSWENKNAFIMRAKEDAKPYIVIVKAEENGCLALLWPSLENAAKMFFQNEIEKIGKAMKQP